MQTPTVSGNAGTPSILDVIDDPALFRAFFVGPSWRAWRALLAMIFGLPVADADAPVVEQCTGRQPTSTAVEEAWLICGRRAGKSRVSALLAVYLACFRRYTLAPGERGVFMVLAADRRQARVVFRYVLAFLDAVSMLRKLIDSRTTEAVHLRTGISIEVLTASFRAVRGYTIIGAIADEIAFWPTAESANPDREILDALRPAMATVGKTVLAQFMSSRPISSTFITHGRPEEPGSLRRWRAAAGDFLAVCSARRTVERLSEARG